MITLLVLSGEYLLIVADDIILQLTHSLIFHTCNLMESLSSLVKSKLRRAFKRIAVLVEIRAEQRYGGYFSKRIYESRTESRQHIEIAATSLNKAEEAGTVDTLATGEDGLKVVEVVDHEIQCLQLPVTAGIHEVHHADVIINNVVDDVGFRKFRSRFLKSRYNKIGIQFQVFVVHNCLKFA